MRQVFDSFAGIDNFLVYLTVSLAYLAVFVALYLRVTPYREIELIRQGNMAAAFSLSGSILGFVIALAASVQHSVSLVDMAIWGSIAMLVQIAAFMVARLLIPSISEDIPANKTSVGFFLGSLSLAVGLLNAASMSY
jgi:putative membrane protein